MFNCDVDLQDMRKLYFYLEGAGEYLAPVIMGHLGLLDEGDGSHKRLYSTGILT